MTRDEIIAMAREASQQDGTTPQEKSIVLYAAKSARFLERFASLVASAKDAEIARLNDALRWEQSRAERVGTHGPGCWKWGPSHYECALREIEKSALAMEAATLVEREACAKVCEERAENPALSNHRRCDADLLAREIRARGNP